LRGLGEKGNQLEPAADVALNAVFADLPDASSRREEENRHLPLDPISNAQDAAYAAKYAVCPDPLIQKWEDAQIMTIAAEEAMLVRLLRDITGPLPFRDIRIDPAWLAWSDGVVGKLAASIYEGRAFEQMPILADALEEAGCDDAEILGHCRGPGPHARGCWVIDSLSGRQ
jgi:hypothetical protein